MLFTKAIARWSIEPNRYPRPRPYGMSSREVSGHHTFRGEAQWQNGLRVPATANDNGDGQPAIERRSSLCQLVILFSKYTLDGETGRSAVQTSFSRLRHRRRARGL